LGRNDLGLDQILVRGRRAGSARARVKFAVQEGLHVRIRRLELLGKEVILDLLLVIVDKQVGQVGIVRDNVSRHHFLHEQLSPCPHLSVCVAFQPQNRAHWVGKLLEQDLVLVDWRRVSGAALFGVLEEQRVDGRLLELVVHLILEVVLHIAKNVGFVESVRAARYKQRERTVTHLRRVFVQVQHHFLFIRIAERVVEQLAVDALQLRVLELRLQPVLYRHGRRGRGDKTATE
jgi:hypothetical protein